MAQSKKNTDAVAEKPKRTRPDRAVQTEPGDNAHFIRHGLTLSALPKISMTDAQAVAQRVTEYFRICEQDDIKPSVAGLCLALDTDRQYLWELRTKGKNPEVADILKKATKTLELQLINNFQSGKINPVAGIFLLKNHFGYKDQSDTVVTVKQEEDTKTREELEAKYKASVVAELEDGTTILNPPEE